MSDDNKNIDDIIKGGFDDTNDDFNLDSWDDLANRMDQNDDLDGSIASAFNTAEEEVPSSVWSNVNDDLDINTVWSRIDAALTQRKRRALIWWNAASIAFVILIIVGLFTRQSIDQVYTAETLKIVEDKVYFSNSAEGTILDHTDNSIIQKSTNDQTPLALNTSKKLNEKIAPKQVNKNYRSENATKQNKPFEGNLPTSIPTKESVSNDHTFSISTLKPLILSFNAPVLTSLVINDVHTHDTSISHNNITNVGLTDKPAKKWLFGVKGSVVNSAIIDGLSSEANSQNSLVSNNFTVSSNPALFAQYNLKNGFFLQSDLYLNYRVRRSVNTYDQLEFVSKTTELDYLMFDLKIGKSISLSEPSAGMKLNIALGGYWDYLKSQREYRNRTLINEEKSYRSNNYGLDAEIAIQHNFDRLAFSYGTQFDIGLQNINQESTKLGSFNSARTFSYGLFFRLGYRL